MKHLVWALILLTGNAMAQTETDQAANAEPETTAVQSPAASPQPPCETEEHHQFYFWVGEWNVTQNGQPAGHNIIKKVHGCALFENWTSATSNFTGSSLNIYDQSTGKWHQAWVDVNGTLLQIDGGMVDGKMVMSSISEAAGGATTHNRITWTPNEDGRVLQTRDTSPDGETLNTVFNGLYVRVSGSK